MQGKQQHKGGVFLSGPCPIICSLGAFQMERKQTPRQVWVGRGLSRSLGRAIFKQIRLLRALPDLTLNDCRGEAPTTSLGNFCQCYLSLLEKKFFLVPLGCFPSLFNSSFAMRQKLLSLQSPELGIGEVFGLQTVSYWHS